MVDVWGLMRAARAQRQPGTPVPFAWDPKSPSCLDRAREARHPMSPFRAVDDRSSGSPGPHPPTTAPRCGCLLGWAETWTTFHPPNKPQPPRSIHVARRTTRLVPSFIASPSSQLVYHTVSAVPVLQTLAANPVQVDQVSSLSQVFPASVLARSFVFRHLPSLPRAARRPPAADMTGDSGLVMRPSTPPALLSWAAGGERALSTT